MVTELEQPALQSQEEEPPQAQQPAGGGQPLDQAVQEHIAQAVRPILGELASVVQQLWTILWQAVVLVAQQLWELLRPMLLEALHELVQPLLQRTAERGVAAVLKTLESTLQGRTQVQPAPAGAPEAAAR